MVDFTNVEFETAKISNFKKKNNDSMRLEDEYVR